MRTDDLIAMLSTNVELVDRRELARTFAVALTIGGAATVAIVFLGLGPRTDLTDINAFVPLLLKVLFTVVVFALASTYLIRLARPGGKRRAALVLLAVPFAAIIVLAAISLALAPHSHWNSMIVGN
ncbi:MAG: NrsF family protein, partial [Rhodoplanes sp.]